MYRTRMYEYGSLYLTRCPIKSNFTPAARTYVRTYIRDQRTVDRVSSHCRLFNATDFEVQVFFSVRGYDRGCWIAKNAGVGGRARTDHREISRPSTTRPRRFPSVDVWSAQQRLLKASVASSKFNGCERQSGRETRKKRRRAPSTRAALYVGVGVTVFC